MNCAICVSLGTTATREDLTANRPGTITDWSLEFNSRNGTQLALLMVTFGESVMVTRAGFFHQLSLRKPTCCRQKPTNETITTPTATSQQRQFPVWYSTNVTVSKWNKEIKPTNCIKMHKQRSEGPLRSETHCLSCWQIEQFYFSMFKYIFSMHGGDKEC
jgi:hypothetical protein